MLDVPFLIPRALSPSSLQGAAVGGPCPVSPSSPSERLALGLRIEVAQLCSLFSQVVNVVFHKQLCRFADLFMYEANRTHIRYPAQKIKQ